jgi:signal transduction histidine kinase
MKSIKTRLTYSFMSIVIISILIFVVILSVFLKEYYYKSLEEVLENQIKISANFYSRYFSDTSLEDNIMDNVDVFWKLTSAQVQIIDNSGQVLMDSIGVKVTEPVDTVDFKRALEGETGRWIGKPSYTDEPVMAVAYPLKSNQDIIGVMRFITSLVPINSQINKIMNFFIAIGLIVIVISGIISFILANGIIRPVKEVTKIAEKMAAGDFQVRSVKRYDDEIGKLSDTLNYMAEEIIKRDNIKNEFIASVSHELRTPLTSIKGWAIILNTADPEERQLFKDGLKIIEKETERLSDMVEDLLDFSKLISGKMTLSKKETDVNMLVEYIKRHMTPIADRNNIKFLVECDENLPAAILDENRIKQVLINVLDNAFKFTEQGGWVKFTTRLEDKFLVMTVEDNGCGISQEELPNVKQKFYKGKNSRSSSGIGLSVSDEIVIRHNGELNIESQKGEGTKVIIRLPLK